MELVKTIRLKETASTNLFLHNYSEDEGKLMTVVVAEHQSAGRGQGKNTWESEPGKNLLFSIKTHPMGLDAARQYVMLEAGALSVRDALRPYTGSLSIKWPNDIYWHDCKISGTLSECTVIGRQIDTCIVGTGVNINQRTFSSDAPNPVSLLNILGREVQREDILKDIINRFMAYLSMVNEGRYDEIDRLYAAALYRRRGRFIYRDSDGEFSAEIEQVEPGGHLLLRRDDGRLSRYAFKEVSFVLPGMSENPDCGRDIH